MSSITSVLTKAGHSAGNLKIRTKLLSGFLVVVVLMIAVGLVGRSAMAKEDASNNALYGHAKPIIALYALNGDLDGERIRSYRHGMATDPAQKKTYESEIADKEKLVDDDLAAYVALFPNGLDPAREKMMAAFKSGLAAYRSVVHDEFLPASRARAANLSTITEDKLSPGGKAAGDLLDGLSQLEFKETTALNNVSGHTYRNSSHLLLLLLGLGVTVAIGMASLISSTVSRAIKKLVVVVEGLADGDLTRHADLDTKDELGQMANALNRAMDRTRDALRRIGASLQTLTASSEQLTAVSADMTTSADSTAAQAESASAAAEEVSANVSSVAAGTEEMSASILEIAQHASEASVIASAAVSQAAATNDTIGVLGEASSQIDEVVKTIAAIAEQTNLLALNATIEAARAGEMGKGFAVVATEVKELAQQTARATADVTDRIGAIQTNTGAAVEAIVHIGKTIGQINDATGTIAAAVEEQTATTNEIGRSASEAAVGSGEIARNILGVAEGAASTTQSLLETRAAATDVADTASELESLVGQFRY